MRNQKVKDNLLGVTPNLVCESIPHTHEGIQFCKWKIFSAFADGKYDFLLTRERRVKERTLLACALIICSFINIAEIRKKHQLGMVNRISLQTIADRFSDFGMNHQAIKIASRRLREAGLIELLHTGFPGVSAVWKVSDDTFKLADCDKAWGKLIKKGIKDVR